ncbi:phosphoglucosamine mutase [Pseudomonadota bacterium]|nr:phosphoglucosamine mutase [Pseudomonadota bacterium]
MSESRLFGTDGVRGRYGKYPIDETTSSKLGYLFATFAGLSSESRDILVGRDTRVSGPVLESSFTAGVIAAGYTPVLCGVISTPGLAKILSNHRYAGGAMISASHNPYFDNGFKFFGSSGQKIPERKINQIEEKINSIESPFMMTKKLQDRVKFINGASSYLNSINQKKKYTSNKIILDCANGSLSHIANKFFEPQIRNLVLYGTRPDGFNINHLCGSTNISFLQEEVLKNQADIGFAFDGDGDRIIVVDNTGAVLDGDDILYIIATYMQNQGTLKGGVIGTEMSNIGLELALNELGISFVRTSVGDQNIIKKLRELKWSLGGEPSGHIIIPDWEVFGDGLICANILLEIVENHELPIDQLVKGLTKRYQENLNIETSNKYAIFNNQRLKDTISQIEDELDGKSRILVRPSGTEPKLRVLVESDDASIRGLVLKTVAEQVRALEKIG